MGRGVISEAEKRGRIQLSAALGTGETCVSGCLGNRNSAMLAFVTERVEQGVGGERSVDNHLANG